MHLSKKFIVINWHLKYLFIFILLLAFNEPSQAQCPANIDFEEGTFNNWQCWSQSGYTGGPPNTTLTTPTAERHDMLSDPPGNGRDLYGNFPKNCPNGSGHSVRIGNQVTGTTADEVSFTFTIPLGQNTYNLIYHYAIVLNDAGHTAYQQPRMIISVLNVTDNIPLPCPLPPIVVNGSLPGFFDSPVRAPNGSLVRCKNWAAASIKLDNNAGKIIKITFGATGCGLTNGSHFGYAYIDLNSECSSSFIGATYCPDAAFINVTAPYGYETYKWWNILNPAIILANTQVINFTPPPPSGTTLQVAVTPYAGYGCNDTLTAQLLDTLTVMAQAGPDRLSCQNTPVPLGVNPTPTYVYSWSPVTGLSNPNIANPTASPSITTQYVLTVSTLGGGCATKDTVIVKAAVLDTSLLITGPIAGCIVGSQPTTLQVSPADSIQWYLNGVAIPGANQTQYQVLQGGSYYATLFSFIGCNLSTTVTAINVNPMPIVGFNINSVLQCFSNNQFTFTNTSSVLSGTLLYNWNFGDATSVTTRDANHTYTLPGTYTVKLIITTNMGCIDSISFPININPSPVSGFTINANNQCLLNNQFIYTNSSTLITGTLQYKWTLGDGSIVNTRDVIHSYALPGTYTVKLVVSSNTGCADSTVFDVYVNPAPTAGFSITNTQQCFINNQFNFINTSVIANGTLQYLWYFGDGTTAITRDVNHSYVQPGDFTVKMVATSDKGCADSISFGMKVHKYAIADFFVTPICVNLRLPLSNKTINNTTSTLNYLWDFGNGQSSTAVNPIYSYPSPGPYTIKLSVNSAQCPLPLTVKQYDIIIDAPITALRYVDKTAVLNFPERLQARLIGSSVLWIPSISLDNPLIYNPSFKGINSQQYIIQLKTLSGCLTVDSLLVKTRKKIEIYVPSSFTPNGDGLNDYLRPILMGFSSVRYFKVYSRWGKLLFQMQSDLPGWNGKINGQRQELQTVVWVIEAVDVDGVTHKKQGTSILLR